MATYVNNLRLKEITTGDEDGTWGTSTNTNLELITDGFSYGTKEIAADANETFTMPDATADATRSLYLKFTSAVDLTATREITLGPNTVSKTWIIENATTGGQIITIKQGSGATVDVANGSKVLVVTDGAGAGAAVLNANPTEVGGTVTSVGVSGGTTGLTTSGGPVTSSGTITLAGTLAVANGGTGSTTAAGALTNLGLTATAAELNTLDGITATTTELNYTDGVTSNIQTQLNAKGVGSVTSVAVSGGTTGLTTSGGPLTSSGTITIAGTLAVANGGTGVTSSTGSGSLVLSTSPTLTTPNIGTPSAGTLSNCTVDGTNDVGFKNVPQNSQNANYTLVLSDSGKHIAKSDTTTYTWTIPANASVAFPIGTAITFVNYGVSGNVTINITSDTLILGGDGNTGFKTLYPYGIATAIKVATTTWIISGNGID